MKNTLSLLIALLLLSSFSGSSSSEISWDDQRLLTWEDFKAAADEKSHADALTAIRISAKPIYKKGKISYDVNAYFLQEKSWFKSKSEHLLAHEQLHFDLAELYARKIRYMISEYTRKGIKDPKKINAGIQQLLDESNVADQQYDFETLHGALKGKQASWDRTVKLEMMILSQYSKSNWH